MRVIRHPPLRQAHFISRKDEHDLATLIHKILQEVLASVLGQLPALLSKLEKAEPEEKDVASDLDLKRIRSLVRIGVRTGAVAVKTSRRALEQINEEAATYDTVDKAATDWATERAARLVGMRRDAEGNLTPAIHSEYRIDNSTRNMLRSTLRQAVEEGLSTSQLRDALSTDYAFSLERSLTIARTEMAMAHVEGAMIGYRQGMEETGIRLKKIWLLGEEPCDECEENADVGPIDFDDEFPSGDANPPLHPNCRCDVAVEEAEGEDE
jgi:hypothetical protein